MFELSTAIVIVPPHEAQAIAVPLMRQYAPTSLIRFRPHITLLFPFVPYDQLDWASTQLQQLCATIAPFDVTLAGYGEFPGVIYMKPADSEPIRRVFRQIFELFPNYPPYRGQFGNDLQPHMTIAESSGGSLPALPGYEPITFSVDRIHLWYGVERVDLPWLTYDVIRLRG